MNFDFKQQFTQFFNTVYKHNVESLKSIIYPLISVYYYVCNLWNIH